jgi:hypothetical protein
MGMLLALLFVLVSLLLSPNDALAWGPGVHLAIGAHLLERLALLAPALPPGLAALLQSQSDAFLYGSLSADIFIGKGSKPKPQHSHNWSTGRAIFSSALPAIGAPDLDDPVAEGLAYAYGYLAHLAADTVAHNFYVPTMLGLTSGGGRLSHALVELRADWEVKWSRRQAAKLFRQSNPETDRRLLAATKRGPLPFFLKKQIYQRGFLLGKRRTMERPLIRLRRLFRVRDIVFPGPFHHEAFCQEMLDLSLAVTLDLIQAPEQGQALAFDPIGAGRLKKIKFLRPQLYAPELYLDPGRLFPLPAAYQALLDAAPRVFRAAPETTGKT